MHRIPDWLTGEPLRYGLALAVAGLLPVKGRRADRAICFALAMLWASAALSWSYSTGMSWYCGLAGLEALLFWWLSVLRPIALSARNGRWAVAGTALIVYCLAIFPLLRYLRPAVFAPPLGFPFPLVLFTCAVLFFAADRRADLVLAPLLLGWALPGGPLVPPAHAGWDEVVCLEVALLAGALFLLQPEELRAGIDCGAAYRLAVQRRAPFGYGLWALALATAMLAFLRLTDRGPHPPAVFVFHLALLSIFGSLLWLIFPAWQSLWFRYAAWHAARATGRGVAAVRRGWRWGLLLLLAVLLSVDSLNKLTTAPGNPPSAPPPSAPAAGAPLHSAPKPQPGKPPRPPAPPAGAAPKGAPDPGGSARKRGTPLPGGEARSSGWLASPARWWRGLRGSPTSLFRIEPFLAVVLLWLTVEVYWARKRLVIGKFVDHTGDDAKEKWVEGLDLGLRSELARIADLYRMIDEVQPSLARSLSKGILDVTAEVQDVGEILKEAEVSIGTLHVSTKFLSSLLSRIVSSPQITGALSRLDDRYVLTAQLAGGGRSKSWRVDSAALAPAGSPAPADSLVRQMVQELAYRIATDLVPIGSPRWEAVRCYTDGLRFYRETQSRLKDRHLYLRQAERCLIRALNEDQAFTQCHYNLGVVYEDLGQPASAEAAFRRALAEDASRYDACYALAASFAHIERFLEAAWFSRAAIAIDPSQPRAWDLLAFSRRQQGEPGAAIRPEREVAVALAWRALCRAALRGGAVAEKERLQALLCTRNLAVVLVYEDGWREESLRLLEQAAWLDPQSPALRFHRGRALLWSGDKWAAAAALDGTLADGLDVRSQGFLWFALALTRSGHGESLERRVRLVHRRFLDVAAVASSCELEQLIEARNLRSPGHAAAEPGGHPAGPAGADRFAELRRMGLPWGAEGAGYGERLRVLCRFLLALEYGVGPPSERDWERIGSRLDGKARRAARRASIEKLAYLAACLDGLLGADPGARAAAPAPDGPVLPRLRSLYGWTLLPTAGETEPELARRADALAPLLRIGGEDPLAVMLSLAQESEIGSESEGRLRECLEEWLADCRWVLVQLRVRGARLCLEEADAGGDGRTLLNDAAYCLEQAIPALEAEDFRQPRQQDLYGLLARIRIRRARAAGAGLQDGQAPPAIVKTLAYARQSVLLDPSSGRERLGLVEALATLGDYGAMEVEAEIARDLDPGPETLRTVGEQYWRRVGCLHDREDRRRVLGEAARFFQDALENLACAPFDSAAWPEETLGWAHFWLGRFQCERGLYAEASAHLTVAAEMGFKPLEARLELAWTRLLGRDLRPAERIFAEVAGAAEAALQAANGCGVAPAPGEERAIGDLCFDAYLGWALLAAERNPALSLARIEEAKRFVCATSPARRQDQEAAMCEARGRAYLGAGEIDKSLKELKTAVKKGAGAGAYCYLGLAELARARMARGAERGQALRRAVDACRRAKEADVRDRYAREIDELNGEIRTLQAPAVPGAPPKVPNAPPARNGAGAYPEAPG